MTDYKNIIELSNKLKELQPYLDEYEEVKRQIHNITKEQEKKKKRQRIKLQNREAQKRYYQKHREERKKLYRERYQNKKMKAIEEIFTED